MKMTASVVIERTVSSVLGEVISTMELEGFGYRFRA